MKKTICLVLVASLFFSCNKLKDYFPNPHEKESLPEFNKAYGGSEFDLFTSIATSPEGGYVVAGYSYSNNYDVGKNYGFYDAWIIKLDKNGAKEWQKVLGGTGGDVANAVSSCLDGGYIMAGNTSSNDNDAIGNHGEEDAWIVKLDKTGALLWQKELGGTGIDRANAVIASSDGGYLVAGSTYSNDGDVRGNHGFQDAWIVKLDKTGTIVWQKTIGGSGHDEATSAIVNPDGTYIITGHINKGADPDGSFGNNDVLVVKLDNDGNIIWQKALGGSGSDIATSASKTLDGGYVIRGNYQSNTFDTLNVFVMKIDKEGTLKWQKTIEGSYAGLSNGITFTRDGGCTVVAETLSISAWLVKFDQYGNVKWQEARGAPGGDYGNSILTRADGSYIMAGITSSTDGNVSGNHGSSDGWVLTLKDK